MRADEYLLPRAEGDAADGELAVFYFPSGAGGGIDANVQRWRGQFTTPAGKPLGDDDFQQEKREVNGLTVTLVDLRGRYQATSMRFGGTAPPPKDNYRMLGALVETPTSLAVFKVVGPAATITAHSDAFDAFVRSFRLPDGE
jgi:hypothetical protein